MISLLTALVTPLVAALVAGLVAALVAVLVLASVPGVAGAASRVAATSASTATSPPRLSDVVRERFVTSVALDAGAFKVVPAPANDRPTLTRAQVTKEIWASPALLGYTAGPIGFGLVTVSVRVKGVPRITRLPAWVGFAKSPGIANCPVEVTPVTVPTTISPTTPGTAPTGTAPTSPAPLGNPGPSLQEAPSNDYAAVVIGAASGAPAVTYTARSILCESLRPASLAQASEVFSVPWRPLSGVENNSIRVQATLPSCGVFQGISSGGSAQEWTISVTAVVPDVHGRCSGTQRSDQLVYLGPVGNPAGAPPPLVTATTTIRHGPVGPMLLTAVPGATSGP